MEEKLITLYEISELFGRTQDNIRRTYRDKRPSAFRMLYLGSYLMKHNVTDDEIKNAINNIIKNRGIYEQ